MRAIVKEKNGSETVYEVTEPNCCGYDWQLTRIKGQGTYAKICAESPDDDDIDVVIEEYDANFHSAERAWWDSAHPQEIVSAAWKDIKKDYPYVTKK